MIEVGFILDRGQSIGDRDGISARLQERVVVFGVADRHHVVGGEAQIVERRFQAARFVDAGRQHHDRSLVEHDLQLKSVFADRLENQLFVRLPGRDNGSPNGKRSDALLAQGLHQLWRGLGTERRFFFRGGVKEQRSVLRDDAIEKINPGKDANKIGQLASRDEEKLPAGSPEGYERVRGCVLDNSVMRERAIVVGGQTADVHGSPRHHPHEFWLELSKDRHSSGFGGSRRPQRRAQEGTTRVLSGFTRSRGSWRLTPGFRASGTRQCRSTGGYGRFWSMGAWPRLPRCFAKTQSEYPGTKLRELRKLTGRRPVKPYRTDFYPSPDDSQRDFGRISFGVKSRSRQEAAGAGRERPADLRASSAARRSRAGDGAQCRSVANSLGGLEGYLLARLRQRERQSGCSLSRAASSFFRCWRSFPPLRRSSRSTD